MKTYVDSIVPTMMLAVALVCMPLLAAAQEEKPAPEPVTTADPDIDVTALQFGLEPLTQEELVVEADGWTRILQAHLQRMADIQVQELAAEGDTNKALLKELETLREQRTLLIDRTRTVVQELQEKGGDVKTYEAYLGSAGGLKVDATDVVGASSVILSWLKSPQGGFRWARNIVLFVVVLAIAWIVARIIGHIVRKAVDRIPKTSDLLRSFLVTLTRNVIFVIGLVVALSMLEVNIGPLVAAIGATGLVLGFALQGTLSNFAAGLMILIYRPYDVEDYVEVAGTSGSVDAMTLVSTTLRQPDNKVVIIPNNSIWGNVIVNYSGSATRRVDLVMGISYEDDIGKAQGILENVVSAHPKVLKDPEPMIKVHELADSSVNFVVRPWVNTEDYWDVYWDLTRAVKEKFDDGSISIPYPQRDVHVYNVEPAAR